MDSVDRLVVKSVVLQSTIEQKTRKRRTVDRIDDLTKTKKLVQTLTLFLMEHVTNYLWCLDWFPQCRAWKHARDFQVDHLMKIDSGRDPPFPKIQKSIMYGLEMINWWQDGYSSGYWAKLFIWTVNFRTNEEIEEKIVEKSKILIIMIMEPITPSSIRIFVEKCPTIEFERWGAIFLFVILLWFCKAGCEVHGSTIHDGAENEKKEGSDGQNWWPHED